MIEPSPIAQSVALRTWEQRLLVRSSALPIFFPRIDDSHSDRIHSSLTAVCCFDNGYVGKQTVAWKEYCAEYWLKELQKSNDRCTGHHDITEILLKTPLNTIQSINQPLRSIILSNSSHNKGIIKVILSNKTEAKSMDRMVLSTCWKLKQKSFGTLQPGLIQAH